MSHRILLIDDEDDILEFIRYNLTKAGYEVYTARNGAEGLQQAAAHRPHLILLDMMMPVMDGIETCRALRRDPALKETMVVFLSRTAQVAAPVERDPNQPGLQMLLIPKIGRVAQQPEKHLLINVLRIRAASQAAQRQPVNGVAAGFHRLAQECVGAQLCLHGVLSSFL